MKIGYLGAGAWGYCLANILAGQGHTVRSWTTKKDLADKLNQDKRHPHLPAFKHKGDLHFSTDLREVLEGAELLAESVTSAGIRPVFEKVKQLGIPQCPIVITSKGIEQNSGLILPEVVLEVLGEQVKGQIGILSGPGYAEEVIRGLPTSIVASAYDPQVAKLICEAFTNMTFRVYPNADIRGVAFGGALKNIIAIACGVAEGLHLGSSAKAALITRGLHEIRKLAVAQGCSADTINGLSGMGDLCMTCSSTISRNFRFGQLLAQGKSPDQSKTQINMVVEGAYTAVSALQLSQKENIPMPITETIYQIIYEGLSPQKAVQILMQRPIKDEQI